MDYTEDTSEIFCKKSKTIETHKLCDKIDLYLTNNFGHEFVEFIKKYNALMQLDSSIDMIIDVSSQKVDLWYCTLIVPDATLINNYFNGGVLTYINEMENILSKLGAVKSEEMSFTDSKSGDEWMDKIAGYLEFEVDKKVVELMVTEVVYNDKTKYMQESDMLFYYEDNVPKLLF